MTCLVNVCSRGYHLSRYFVQVCRRAQSFSLLSLDDCLRGNEGQQLCCVCSLPLVTAALAAGRAIVLHKKSLFSISAMVGPLLGIKKGDIYQSESDCHVLETLKPLYLRIVQQLIWRCSDPASMAALFLCRS